MRPFEITQFLDMLYDRCHDVFSQQEDTLALFNTFQKTRDNYILAPLPDHPGLFYRYRVQRNSTSIELYIATGDQDANHRLFEQLRNHAEDINRALDAELDWRDLKDNDEPMGIRRIVWLFEGKGGYANDPDEWLNIQAPLPDAIVKFDHVMREWLRDIQKPSSV
ncbi:MAG: hypothetical protein OHK0046_19430 [Anaerolineae bacterium]